MLARTSPQNTLLTEPMRNMVSASGALSPLSLIFPKPAKAISLPRTATSMKPGTLVLRKVSVPVKLTASASSLSSAAARPQAAICAATMVAMQAKPIRVRNLRNVVFPINVEQYHAQSDMVSRDYKGRTRQESEHAQDLNGAALLDSLLHY